MQFDLFFRESSKKLKVQQFFMEMKQAVPWAELMAELKPVYVESPFGRPKTDLLILLKIHFIQKWFNLADLAVEEAIYDRLSFQDFLDLNPSNENVPDETTILNFRHWLEKNNLENKLFKAVNKKLEKLGFLMKRGTIVDATIIN